MPYKSIDELPERVKSVLPKRAQEIFMKAFNAAYHKYGEEKAFRIAWAAVKRLYVKKDGRWKLKSKVDVKKVSVNSDTLEEKVYVDFVLTTPEVDNHKEVFHTNFLERIANKLSGLKGDYEHANILQNDYPKTWLAKIIDSKYINGYVYATAVLNNLHPMFNQVIDEIKQKKLFASIEVAYDEDDYQITDDGYKIFTDGEVIGFAFTKNPKKKDAQIYRLR